MTTQTGEKSKTAKDLWKETHKDMLPPEGKRDDVTVILPALEEDENLRALLPQIEPYYEVCIRADIGLAYAVSMGVAMSHTPIVAVMDADGTHQIHSVHQMVRLMDSEGYDIVCGVRSEWDMGLQGTLSWEGNKFARRRLNIPVADVTSGFFVAKREKLLELPQRVWTGYGDYYMELLAWARKGGWYIGSTKVDYQPRLNGRSHTTLWKCVWIYYRRVINTEREIFPSMKLKRLGKFRKRQRKEEL